MASKKRRSAADDKDPVADPHKLAWPQLQPVAARVPDSNLTDSRSDVCPGCGSRLDFWACEALCHHCGLKFTCDE